MKKTLKITGILLLVVTFLLIITGFILSQFVDPNKFKGRISQYVFAKTGHVLVINGNMRWSLFPWIGLKVNNLVYYNSPTYTPKTFISAKEMHIKVKLIPLATGHIQIGNITLNEAILNLIKDKSGKFNWQNIVKEDKKTIDTPPSKHSNAISTLSITSLKIKNSKLNWYDQQTHSQNHIDSLNISGKHVQLGHPFPISLSFDLLDASKHKNLTLDMSSDIILSPDNLLYILDNIKMKGIYYHQPHKIDFKANGHLTADIKKQNFSTQLAFDMDTLNAKINLSANELSKNSHFRGILTTNEFNVRKILNKLGWNFNPQNSDALTHVSVLSKLDINSSLMNMESFHIKLDQSDIFGNAKINPNDKKVQINLTTNQIRLDDYLMNENHKTENKSGSSSKEDTSLSSSKPSSPWMLTSSVKIKDFAYDKFKLTHLDFNLLSYHNVIKLSPLTANLYKGQMEGAVIINQQQRNKTVISIKENFKNLNIRDLLYETAKSEKLTGTTNLVVDLISTITPNTSFLSGLNGKMNLAIADGSFQGVDIIYQLSRAHNFIKHLTTSGLSDSKQTRFSSLQAEGNVNNGLIDTNNLTLTSEYLKVSGKGTTHLVTKDIHYRLNALAQPKLAEKEEKAIGKEMTVYQIPIKISGKINKPSVNLDFVELAKILYTKQIEKQLNKQLDKNINKLKENLQDKVKDKIKSFAPTKLLENL